MSTKRGLISDEPPHDGREWDCFCARCGSSVDWRECENCVCGLEPEDNVPCDFCGGKGGWWKCLSGHKWCTANPLPGRENMELGRVEWYPMEERNAR